MAKIDTTKIENFENMTADEKVAALLEMSVPDEVDMSGYVKKDLFDKASSELASAKKQIKSQMSAEEQAKADADNARKELEEKYNALLAESTIAKYKAKFLAQGYDEALAESTAKALHDGDTDTVFANGMKFRDAIEKNAIANALKSTPKPNGASASNGKTVTQEDLKKMNYREMVNFANENPALYEQLMNEKG